MVLLYLPPIEATYNFLSTHLFLPYLLEYINKHANLSPMQGDKDLMLWNCFVFKKEMIVQEDPTKLEKKEDLKKKQI